MKFKNLISTAIVIAAQLLLLTACSLAPEYNIPDTHVPESFDATGLKWTEPHPDDDCDRGDWWTIFQDPQLNELEEKLNKDNFNIAAAAAQYKEALALVDQARAAFFPVISATANGMKQKTVGATKAVTTRTLTLNSSWELDLWGAVASNVDANIASAEALEYGLESVRLSSQASLAQFYIEYCTVRHDDGILDQIVQASDKNLKYMRSRYKAGVAGNADILQAEILLSNAQTELINNGINLNLYRHAIAVLVGEQPSTFKLAPCAYDHTPHNIPLGIPSTLLERRPDIAQAERLMAQANSEIGVARAAYFPAVSLSAANIVQGNGLHNLFSFPLTGWSAGVSAVQSIFNGGAQIAATTAAEEKFNTNVAAYRQTVLSAFQDVEDNIATLDHLRDQEKVQKHATQKAKNAFALVENQYRAGTVDYASVLAFRITYYDSLRASSDVEGLRVSSEIGLIKALGGMWNTEQEESQTTKEEECDDQN